MRRAVRGSHPRGLATAVFAALAALAALAAPAAAHVVVGRRTLRSWTRDASVVVLAEVVEPVHAWASADGSERRDTVRLRVLETLRGDPGTGVLRVHPHAEGLPEWPAGARVLAFLEPSGGHASFAAIAGEVPWFTTQGPSDAWTISPDDAETLSLARTWTRAGSGATPDLVRRTLLAQLGARDRRLREDALLELVLARSDSRLFPIARGVRPFARLAGSASPLQVPERLALAKALDGTPGFDAAAVPRSLVEAWPRLSERDRLALVRAAGQSRDPALSRWLASLLDDEAADAVLRREAAAALGHPWHAAQVASLERATRSTDAVLARRAAAALAGAKRPVGAPGTGPGSAFAGPQSTR